MQGALDFQAQLGMGRGGNSINLRCIYIPLLLSEAKFHNIYVMFNCIQLDIVFVFKGGTHNSVQEGQCGGLPDHYHNLN